MWGLYANMIAQLISQISSHFIVHYHRRIIENAKAEYERRQAIDNPPRPAREGAITTAHESIVTSATIAEEPQDRLCQHSFSRQHRLATEKLVPRRYVNYVMILGGVVVSVLLGISCDIPSMKLESLGLVALVIELGQGFKQAVRFESVFSIANLLLEQAHFLGGFNNYIGLYTVAGLFVLTMLAVPIALIVALLFQ